MTISELHQKVEQYNIKGFLADNEAAALYGLALKSCVLAPCLEVGSYCGKSSIYLGEACRKAGGTLYALDHHRGSEEHQIGEEYHDPDLFDGMVGCMDSFPAFRRALKSFNLEGSVIPIVSPSSVVVKQWAAPLGMVFIDGGHSHEMSKEDCLNWSKHIVPGGVLAIHDIFEKPEYGGQGPYLALKAVLEQGGFEWVETVGSLGVLSKA